MKKMLLLVVLLGLASCAIQQMNSKMQEANELMTENIQAMEASKTAIEENTRHIQRSTAAMDRFTYIFPVICVVLVIAGIYIYKKKLK